MEAALRTVYFVLTGKEYDKINFTEVRGLEGVREASLDINGMTVNVAIANGMKSAKGTASRVFTVLAKNDINIRMIDQGSSELNIIVGVDDSDFEKAIRAVYSEFGNK